MGPKTTKPHDLMQMICLKQKKILIVFKSILKILFDCNLSLILHPQGDPGSK